MPDLDPALEKHDDAHHVPQEVDVDIQQYASPSAQDQDADPFYSEHPQQGDQDQAGLDQQEEQEHLEGPPTPHRHNHFTSVAELQLAAQLSQGLAVHNVSTEDSPMIDSNEQGPSLEQVMEQHNMQQLEMADPQGMGQEVPEHTPELRDHEHGMGQHDGLQVQQQEIPAHQHDPGHQEHELGHEEHELGHHEEELGQQHELGDQQHEVGGQQQEVGDHQHEMEDHQPELGGHQQGVVENHHGLDEHQHGLEEHNHDMAGHDLMDQGQDFHSPDTHTHRDDVQQHNVQQQEEPYGLTLPRRQNGQQLEEHGTHQEQQEEPYGLTLPRQQNGQQLEEHGTHQEQQEEPYGLTLPRQQNGQQLEEHGAHQQQQEEPYGLTLPQQQNGQQHLQHQHQHQHQPQPQPQHPQQPHLQPASLGHLPGHFQQPSNDTTPPRKRSKVSRACDECRRKKVKCDAPSETGDEPCSNCYRSNIQCLFSRVPQKRGPSKGYIKELADRINSIEGKLASEGGNVDSLTDLLAGTRRESHEFTPAAQSDDNSRKRPYSSISGGDFGTPPRQSTWGAEARPVQPYQTPSGSFKGPYTTNGLAPLPVASKESDASQQPAAMMDGISFDLNGASQGREVSGDVFATYLDVVHPCFPVLETSKARLDALLAQCPSSLREAFVVALNGTVHSFPPFSVSGDDVAAATRTLTNWELEKGHPERTYAVNLVHLQTLILIAIQTDNYGPGSVRGEHGGVSKSSVLGMAIGKAFSMRLHLAQVDMNVEIDFDLDSDEHTAIRCWWTLIMLDRWNAISTASPLLIPNASVVVLPSLSPLLGESGYHLARLSNILGHFAPVALAPPQAMTHESGAAPLLSSFLNLSMELFREVLPPTISPSSHPILHLAYWHCRLLAYLFQFNTKCADILWPCKESVSLLTTNPHLITPLNHHFLGLTTLSLLGLAKVEATKDEAISQLKVLLDSNLAPSAWDATIRDRIAEHIRPTTAQASMDAASQGLQHLAELATASKPDPDISKEGAADSVALRTSDNHEDVGFDPRPLTRGGYLTILSEPRPYNSR